MAFAGLKFCCKVATFQVENAIWERALLAFAYHSAHPTYKGWHIGHGTRDNVVELLFKLLDTTIYGADIFDTYRLANTLDNSDLLAY